MNSVSERIATVIEQHADEVFALMGNGNAYFLDALSRTGVRTSTVRHETATVAAADAYHRVSGKLAVASTTFGPGFTNAISSLAEAAQARSPLLLVVGDSPSTGARPWDVDQRALAQGRRNTHLCCGPRKPVPNYGRRDPPRAPGTNAGCPCDPL